MPSALQHYWHLASASSDERLISTKSLIGELEEHQNTADTSISASAEGLTIMNDSSDKEGSDEDFAKRVAEAEQELDKRNSEEVCYATRRLLKGLASHRDSSRLGFSVALCELISRLQIVSARHLIVLVKAYSSPSTKVKGQEERDLLFARLFGLYAIVQSGILIDGIQSTHRDFKDVLQSVWYLGRSKTWLRESSASIIVDAIHQLAKSEVGWKEEVPLWLAQKICEAREIGPDSIAILLVLQKSFQKALRSMPKIPLLASNTILASCNLTILAKILRDGADLDVGKANAEKVGGSPAQGKAHFVWDILLQECLQSSRSKTTEQSSFSDAYKVLVDEGLFASTASDQKKYWGFQIFEKALHMVTIDDLASIFTPNFMRTWMNHLANRDRILYKAAQHGVTIMLSMVRAKPAFGAVIIRQLIRSDGAPFDTITGTKTVESILVALASEDAVEDYIRYLITATCQPAREDAHKSRRWALDQLMSLIRNGSLSCREESIMNVLGFFAGHGFFDVHNQAGTSDDSPTVFSVSVAPPFTSDIKSICRTRFLSCLGDLNDRKSSSNTSEGEVRRQQGIMKNGSSWVSAAYDMVSSLEAHQSRFTSLSPTSQSDLVMSVLKLRKELIKKRQKSKDEIVSRQLQDFETMLLSGLLYSRTMEAEASNDLMVPICECAEQMLSEKEGENASAIHLLVPCIVSYLELPNSFLRSTATQCFASFTGDIDQEALEQLLDHLGFEEKDGEATEEGEGSSEAEDEYSDEEDFSDSVSVTSASSVSIGKDESVDPVLVAKLQEVLQAAGAADDADDQSSSNESSSDVGSDFDDDQMMQIDDKLAEIFKQRLGSRKEEELVKREAVTLHIKILDLLDVYAKRHSSNPLCINLVLPLFTIVMEKDALLGQLKQKASTILQKTICKSKDGPLECVDEDEVIKPMEAIHRIATTQLVPAVSTLCSSVNIYLTKACKKECFQGGKVRELYSITLKDFIDRSSNNLRPTFLIEAFQQLPLLGFEMREELLRAASQPQESAKKVYRRLQALEMLHAVLTSLVKRGDKQQEVTSFLPKVSKAILELVKTQKLRLKEVLKIALDLARLTKKLPIDFLQIETVWSPVDIEACIDAIGSDSKVQNSVSIQNLLRQLLAIVTSEDKTNKRERTDEIEVQAKKRKQ